MKPSKMIKNDRKQEKGWKVSENHGENDRFCETNMEEKVERVLESAAL